MRTFEVITNLGNIETVEIVDSFDLFGYSFLIHEDINNNLFVCTHEKSKYKLPFYADTIKEIKNVSIAFLSHKGEISFNEALKQIK